MRKHSSSGLDQPQVANVCHAPKGPHALSLQQEPHANAAVAIQAWWRGQLVRRALWQAMNSVLSIQAWWRRTIARQQEERRLQALSAYLRLERASVILQAHARMWKARTQYKKYQKAVHTIQNGWGKSTEPGALASHNIEDGVDLNIEIIIG
nr:PREDICTED: IQ domain-containing protein F2-like [Struthio camelus australis]